jgi:secretion/DNA translocation related TadE-like protein
MLLLGTLGSSVVLVASGLTLHRQAVRAADLGALAGAQRALVDRSVACRAAQVVVEANGGVLASCVLERSDMHVVVEVPTSLPMLPDIRATARAGPRD